MTGTYIYHKKLLIVILNEVKNHVEKQGILNLQDNSDDLLNTNKKRPENSDLFYMGLTVSRELQTKESRNA